MPNNLPDKIGGRVTLATVKMQKRKRKFLSALAESGQVTKAAAAAGLKDSSQAYRWRQTDEEFREAWMRLEDDVAQVITDKLVERVVEGTEEPVFYKGEIVGRVRRFDNATGVALVKAMRHRFRDSGGSGINVAVNNFGVALLPMAAPSEEEWEQQSRRLTEQQNKIAAQVIEGTAERVAEPTQIKRG